MTQDKDIHELTDDFRVSAYALGEATPEEAVQIEAMMAENPDLQDEIRAIRGFSTLLSEALEEEPLPEKPEPLGALRTNAKRRFFLKPIMVVATFLVIGILSVWFLPPVQYYRNVSLQRDVELEEPSPSPAVATEKTVDRVEEQLPQLPQLPQYSPAVEEKASEALEVPAEKSLDADALRREDSEEVSDVYLEREAAGVAMQEKQVEGVLGELPAGEMNRDAAPVMAAPLPSLNKQRMAEKKNEMAEATVAEQPQVILPVIPQPKPEEKPFDDQNSYQKWVENKFQTPTEAPFSTFGVDVDTASYTLTRQYLTEYGRLPDPDSIRVEEFINYFTYDLPQPKPEEKCPFATLVEIQKHPWAAGRYLASVSLKGREIPKETRPPLNLVFLLDVSGSMSDWNKLPLVKDGMMKLLDQLGEKDYVTIVTYANDSGVKLEPTCGTERRKIEKAILELNASGGTSGAAGIQTAYEAARKHFNKESVNRVILCTDGDFNIGMTNNDELEQKITDEARSGVFLTVFGFGMGNFHDDRLKRLSSKGNGNYGYVDSREEAQRLLCDELCGTLITIAKDVKLQIEFNPANVAAYRLIGYENRKLNDEDFHNDKKDSGDIGAGHSVTALYEIVPVGEEIPDVSRVDAPRYQKTEDTAPSKEEVKPAEKTDEWMYVKLRYKLPEENTSTLLEIPVSFDPAKAEAPSANFQFASGVALFAMLLRHSDYTENATFDTVLELIHPAIGERASRKELEKLVQKAKTL